MGQLKLAKLEGKFQIRKLNSMYYFNEITKDWEIYSKEKFEEYIKNRIYT